MKTLFNNYNLNHHNLLSSSTSATVLNTSTQLCNSNSQNTNSLSSNSINIYNDCYTTTNTNNNVGIVVDDTAADILFRKNNLNLANQQQSNNHQKLKKTQDLLIDKIMKKEKNIHNTTSDLLITNNINSSLAKTSEINNNTTTIQNNNNNESDLDLKSYQDIHNQHIHHSSLNNNNNISNSMLNSKENQKKTHSFSESLNDNGKLKIDSETSTSSNKLITNTNVWTSSTVPKSKNYPFHKLSKSDNILRLSLESNNNKLPETNSVKSKNYHQYNQKRNNTKNNNNNNQLAPFDKLIANSCLLQTGSTRFEELASLSSSKNDKKETSIKSVIFIFINFNLKLKF